MTELGAATITVETSRSARVELSKQVSSRDENRRRGVADVMQAPVSLVAVRIHPNAAQAWKSLKGISVTTRAALSGVA
jgi:hypothetical protein